MGNRENIHRLSQVADINPPVPRVQESLDVSFVGMEDVSENGFLTRTQVRKRGEIGNGYTGFIENDVLVAKITPCFENGKGAFAVGLRNGIGFGSTEFHVVRARESVSPRFIYHHTKTMAFLKKGEQVMSGSAGQKRVPANFLEDYQIPIPLPERQLQNVELLDAAERDILALDLQLAAIRLQKRGLMQKLLSSDLPVPASIDRLLPGAQYIDEAVGAEVQRAEATG